MLATLNIVTHRSSLFRRPSRALAAASLLLAAGVASPFAGVPSQAAGATTTAAATTQTAEVFDPRPVNTWGVEGLDLGSGNFQYYSPVFAFAQIGDTVYSGGKFTGVTNGTTSVDQPYLAAFDESGSSWRAAFRPEVDWSVFALETSADGSRLFVGGEFTGIGGTADTAAFTALDPTTGAVDETFGVSVGRASNPPRVHDLERHGDWLYVAGAFSTITGSDGRTYSVSNLARVHADTGVVDAAWRPRATQGSVWEITPDPARERVLLGGLFHEVNGVATRGFAMVDEADGSVEDYDYTFGTINFNHWNGYIFASTIEVAGDQLIIGGQQHRVLLTTPDLQVTTGYQTNNWGATNGGRGGDTQALAVHDGVLYVACHCWGRTMREETGELYDVRSLYAIDLATGDFIENFAPDFSGSSGPWALHVDPDGCLWVGTDATQAGQGPGRGVAKLCERPDLAGTITSITSDGQPVADGERLIDGDIVTNWSDAHQGLSIAETARPSVDLTFDEPIDIERLVLWNRTDEGRDQLHDVHVWLSDQPFTTTDWAELRQDPNVTEIRRPGDHRYKRTLPITVGGTAQYVRIQVDASLADGGTGRLDLTELAVFGEQVDSVAPIVGCQVAVSGTTATVTWEGAAVDHVIYRSVNGSRQFWRGRTDGGTFVDELRIGLDHLYSVAPVNAGQVGQTVTCEPGPVTTEATTTLEVTSPRQTRERIVLRWERGTAVTILRDGVEIGTDSDGWFTDRGLTPDTTHTYTLRSADGDEGTITVATLPQGRLAAERSTRVGSDGLTRAADRAGVRGDRGAQWGGAA